jgi:starch synthase
MRADSRRILFVASEAIPFSKTGGLADVAGALPRALKRLGCDVRVVLPFYRATREAGAELETCLENVSVQVGGERMSAGVFRSEMEDGVPCYLVQRDEFFDREYLYATPGADYPDNALRFSYFCKAVFSVCKALPFSPDVLHCHDWQTALAPAYLRYLFGSSSRFRNTRSLLTLHNLAYQGAFPPSAFAKTDLPAAFFSVGGMEFWGKANFLKAGLVTADLLNTVSPTYGREILTEEFGCGLEGVLAGRKGDLYGILNGADYNEWDPRRDAFLACSYGPESLGGKQTCKAALLKEMGIGLERAQAPLFGMISRLTSQKGLDLVLAGLPEMMRTGLHFVLLGDGEAKYRAQCEDLSRKFFGRFSFRYGFDVPLAHRIQAGVDFLLMPSRYEPCGLNQIYSMRYGTIPVVRATGGLKDTVTEFDASTMEGTGFLFEAYEPAAMMGAVWKALRLYEDAEQVDRVRGNCMRQSFSWDRSAEAYLALYERLRSPGLSRRNV